MLPVHDLTLHVDRDVVDAAERLHCGRVPVDGRTVTLHRLDVSAVVELTLA